MSTEDFSMADLELIEDIDTLARRIDYMLHKEESLVFELNEYQEKIEEASAALEEMCKRD